MIYFCPACQCPDVETRALELVYVDADATCPLCGWKGKKSELLTALRPGATAEMWTPERIGNVMLMTTAKHAAGPMIQLLEMIGLLPALSDRDEDRASAAAAREHVAKAIFEAVVTAAFTAAGEVTPAHYAKFDPEMKPVVDRIFSFGSEPA